MKPKKILQRRKVTKKLPANAVRAKTPRQAKKASKEEIPPKIVTIGIHNLSAPRGSHKKRKYLGRGSSSGHGKTSTRGSKGQTSRAGRDFYLGFEGGQMPLIRKIPKRGFTNIFKKEYQIVNLRDLNKLKESVITPQILEARGLIKDKDKPVKLLGDGEINKVFTIQAQAFSKKAAEKINKAGGKLEVVNV